MENTFANFALLGVLCGLIFLVAKSAKKRRERKEVYTTDKGNAFHLRMGVLFITKTMALISANWHHTS
jgi:hypothetical protein